MLTHKDTLPSQMSPKQVKTPLQGNSPILNGNKAFVAEDCIKAPLNNNYFCRAI